MEDIFISYKSEDRKAASRLADALRSEGWKVWWDDELYAGARYRKEITRSLDACKAVVVLWSKLSIESDWVLAEAERGMSQEKLVQARLEKISLPLPFNQLQFETFDGWVGDRSAAVFRRLVEALSRLAGTPPTAAPRRRALVVAASRAGDLPLLPLPGTQSSASDLARLLGHEACLFEVQTLQDPESRRLKDGVRELLHGARSDDVLLFYFTGYASVSDVDGVCLLSSDTEAELLEDTSLPLSRLRREIDRTRTGNVVLLFDCIYAPFSERERGATLVDRLTDQLGQGSGKWLITASSSLVAPGTQPVHPVGTFTKALVAAVERWYADRDGDGAISLEEWFEYAAGISASPDDRAQKLSFNTASTPVLIARRERAKAAVAKPEAIDVNFLTEVQSLYEEGCLIPILGDGVFGSGPLSAFSVIGALEDAYPAVAAVKAREQYPLATIAEFCVELVGGQARRDVFLRKFREILELQREQSPPRSVHDLILQMPAPWLVVSPSYDDALERRLEQAHKPHVVVAHVLRSAGNREDGKVLVVRKDESGQVASAEVLPADELDLDERSDRVVYKLLGSPFLGSSVLPERKLDTVVLTETDHILFLSRLDNQQMQVPSAFAPAFQSRELLFLGYNLDVWHYRLIGYIFSAKGPARVTSKPIAVRQPTSPMEQRFWERLNARLLRADPERLSEGLLQRVTR